MKIECILKRDGGTKADIDGIEYHFEPLSDGAHVAEIEKTEHIDRFLAIPEGYKVYHGKEVPSGEPVKVSKRAAAAPAESSKLAVPLAGSFALAPQFEIGGKIITQSEAVKKAFDASGLSSDEWNDLDDEDRVAKIEIALDDLADAADEAAAEGDDREALVEAYKAKFGKAPHHKTSIETIKAKLAE
jgi:hypothetical protein